MKRINSCFEMRVLFLFILMMLGFGISNPYTMTLKAKLHDDIFYNVAGPHFSEDLNSGFFLVSHRQYHVIQYTPFKTEDEALAFANTLSESLVSIRHVEPAMKLHLNVTKVRRVVEEEIRKWVK